SGFGMLEDVATAFTIRGNAALTNLSGFGVLRTVGGAVAIADHPVLPTITGLTSLQTVGSHFEISHNNGLTQFNSVDSLQSVGNDLIVARNPQLTSISGLNSGTLTTASGIFYVAANPQLPSCQVDKLRTALAIAAPNDRSCCNSGCTTCAQPAATCSVGAG